MSERPPLRGLGSTPWPWVVLAIVLVGGAYVDLRLDLAEMEFRLHSVEQSERVASPAPADPNNDTPEDRSLTENDDCTGTVAPEAIQRALAARGQEVFACYERRADPAIRGVLEITIRVRSDGSVESTNMTGNPARDGGVTGCLGPELESWQFGPIDGACAVVNLPFALGGEPNPLLEEDDANPSDPAQNPQSEG